ncbi:alpha/beta fold hydrolase [Aeromicrobium sp. 9AM]|uniref:alpha/beta fold hydrolase n=1 Tax=Aeromicrobium sp. 9AM TaxID=2653126 RepID=UPI0012EFBC6A|nr:alpha/beta hydrolase [Aeromicrobium sp. 9AM]VXB77978.1 Alpha/beta hydrolase [Aeromicrobium sp. 9AM]
MATIDTPFGHVHYRVAGPDDSAAPPVVFVHGFLVNHELWTGVADALAAQGIRSYAPDLPLGSHPIALDADLSPQDVARLINDFIAALDLTDVTLVGNDTGGALCQFLIDTDHSRIGRLVLTNCDAFDKFPPPPFEVLFKVGRSPMRLRTMMASMRPRMLRHSMLGYGGLVAKPLDPTLTTRWITPCLRDTAVRRDTSKFLRKVKPADLLDVSTRLNTFGKPVRLVWGNADRFFKLADGQRLREAFGDNAELVEVDGGRTFVPLDEPERVADEIRTMSYSPG